MRLGRLSIIAFAAVMISRDSIAQSDAPGGTRDAAGSAKLNIPPRVDEAELPIFDAEPFPDGKSKTPTLAEWTVAPRVRLTRMARGIGCTAKRVREWMKIRCERKTAGLRLIAGSTDGIA